MEVNGQLGMDETLLEDTDLESALEERAEAGERMAAVRQGFREKDTAAKALIEERVPVGVIARVGRFRIERKQTEARHVEFDTKPSVRVRIAADTEE